MVVRSSSMTLEPQRGTTLSGNSIFDSDIQWRNWMIANKGPVEIASNVWAVGKAVGVIPCGEEIKIVQRLQHMEVWDRVAAGRMGVEDPNRRQ